MPTDIQVKDKEGYLWKILHNCKEHREEWSESFSKISNPASSNLEFWFPINYWKFVKVQSVQKQDFFPRTRK